MIMGNDDDFEEKVANSPVVRRDTESDGENGSAYPKKEKL